MDTTPDDQPENPVGARKAKTIQFETQCFALRVRGFSQEAIAKRLGKSRTAVRKALDRIEKRTLARLEARVARTKARQAGQLEYLLMQAMEGWEKSKLPARKVKRKTVEVTIDVGTDGQTVRQKQPGVEVTRETTYRDGDPRWLAEARGVLQAERALWQIGKPGGEDEDGEWTYDDIEVEAEEEAYADMPPDKKAKVLEFKARKVRAELAELERKIHEAQTQASPLPLPPVDTGDSGGREPEGVSERDGPAEAPD